MTHGLIHPPIGVGRVMAGVMNHRSFQVQRKKAGAEKDLQGPSRHKPTPDGYCSQGIATEEQPNGGVPKGRRVNEFAWYRAVSHSNRTRLLLLSSALMHPEDRQQVWNVPEPP